MNTFIKVKKKKRKRPHENPTFLIDNYTFFNHKRQNRVNYQDNHCNSVACLHQQ